MKHKYKAFPMVEEFVIHEYEMRFNIHDSFIDSSVKSLKLLSSDVSLLKIIKFLIFIWGDFETVKEEEKSEDDSSKENDDEKAS